MLKWNRTLTCKTLGKAPEEDAFMESGTAGQQNEHITTRLLGISERTRKHKYGGKIFFTSITLDLIYFRQLKQKLGTSQETAQFV